MGRKIAPAARPAVLFGQPLVRRHPAARIGGERIHEIALPHQGQKQLDIEPQRPSQETAIDQLFHMQRGGYPAELGVDHTDHAIIATGLLNGRGAGQVGSEGQGTVHMLAGAQCVKHH
ncbi:hypothetical protein D9M71_333780 [compost metagenome]